MAPSGILRPWKSPLPASNSGPTPRRAGKRFPININFNLKENTWERFPRTKELRHTREFFSPWKKTGIRFFDPTQLGGAGHAEQATLHGLLLPRYDPSATSPTLTPIPGVAAANLILPQLTQGHPNAGAVMMALLREAPVYQVVYADARDVLAGIVSL